MIHVMIIAAICCAVAHSVLAAVNVALQWAYQHSNLIRGGTHQVRMVPIVKIRRGQAWG
jgi:hypothetical protein